MLKKVKLKGAVKVKIDPKGKEWVIEVSDEDARQFEMTTPVGPSVLVEGKCVCDKPGSAGRTQGKCTECKDGVMLHRVFVYGRSLESAVFDDPPITVSGRLYVMHTDLIWEEPGSPVFRPYEGRGFACARFDQPGSIRGDMRKVDNVTLAQWDEIEGVGIYSRVQVVTPDGVCCWAYQFEGDVSDAEVSKTGIWGGGKR